MLKAKRRCFFMLVVVFLCAISVIARADEADIDDVEEIILMAPTRIMGSSGQERIQEYVSERFAASGHENGTIIFPTVAFKPGRARLRLRSGQTFDLYAMAPNSAHPGNLPEQEWSGRLVDAGDASRQALSESGSMRDAAVMVDMDSHKRWVTLLELGASVLIFSGNEDVTWRDAADKLTKTPLTVPRFYLPPEAAAELRAVARADSEAVEGAVIEETEASRWETVQAKNHWVIIPGDKYPNKVVHLQTYMDSSSFVPELAPGAEGAANLALLMRLLDYYTENAPQCTLVISAVSDHANFMRGEQFFAAYAFADPDIYSRELRDRHREIEEAEFYAEVYSDRSTGHINRMRNAKEMIAGRMLFLKNPIMRQLEYERNMMRHRLSRLHYIEETQDLDPEEERAFAEERERIQPALDQTIRLANVFQQFGATLDYEEDLTDHEREELVKIMAGLESRFRDVVSQRGEAVEKIQSNWSLIDKLSEKETLLYLTLDISFESERMGIFHQGSVSGEISGLERTVSPLARLFNDMSSELEGGSPLFSGTLLGEGGVVWRNHLADQFAMAATVGQTAAVTSVTLSTVGDSRDRRFTPYDTLDRADREQMGKMLNFAEELLPGVLENEAFPDAPRPHRPRRFRCTTLRYKLRELDPFSVEAPTEPVTNAITINYPSGVFPWRPIAGDVSLFQRAPVNELGESLFRAVRAPETMEAYGFDDSGRHIDQTIDAGEGARRFNPQPSSRLWDWTDHTALLFEAAQTDLVGLFNPATREPFDLNSSIIVLDARQDSSPAHYGSSGVKERRSSYSPAASLDGTASLFLPPEQRFKIVAGELLLLNVTDDYPSGRGFLSGDPKLRMISHTAVHDVIELTRRRLERVTSMGVSIPIAQDYLKEAGRIVELAESFRDQGKEQGFMLRTTEGLSIAMTSYDTLRTTTSDLMRAVAVFLMLVIPFCFFMVKLLTPWTDIRAQIASFVGFFMLMAGSLAVLHPAFSLSQTPLMVLLAFAMVGLAFFVMFAVHSRFDNGIRRVIAESEGVDIPQNTSRMLTGVAFSVGVNNMRRRRIRTTLTTLTIVLITFTMLSVISVGQTASPYQRRIGRQTPYSGTLYAKPGMAPISLSEAAHVKAILGEYGQLTRRSWTQRLDHMGGYMPLTAWTPEAPDERLLINSLLGLDLAEDGFIADMPLVGENSRWFSANDAAEVILTVNAAALLGITPDEFAPRDIRIRERTLKLVGLVDDRDISEIMDIAELPLLPLETSPDPSSAMSGAEGVADLISEEDATRGPAPHARSIRPIDCALMPIDFALRLPDTSYRSIAVKIDDAEKAWEAALHFSKVTGKLTFAGIGEQITIDERNRIDEGQYSLAPPVGATIAGAGKVVIPICLAATIILNTMLGSVMERRREIAIYNSIGLNPTHVFLFFVAEAVVFGMIGAVAGYLIGQALAQAIVYFNLLPGVNLNYSSMSVMIVIFAAVLTVVVSTLYPALMATRAAVPSGQRRWKLPAPDGDEIRVDFPFSFQREQLSGVCAFLHAFMDQNSEASSGSFLAQNARFGVTKDAEERDVLAMVYMITPAPFDLGVNQFMEIYGYYRPKVRAYVLSAWLTRVKGDQNSWMIVNQPFLESLRARLLTWRSQSPENQEGFRERGEAMFAGKRELPTRKEAV